MLHEPAATVAVHESVPSVTVTFPVGVPVPGADTLTVYETVTASPTMDGSGVSDVMAVTVLALLLVCESAVDALPLKVPLPVYVAVKLDVPGLVNVMSHEPAATVSVQLLVPSLTVTLPAGVPDVELTV
jgi:hypothetical protein